MFLFITKTLCLFALDFPAYHFHFDFYSYSERNCIFVTLRAAVSRLPIRLKTSLYFHLFGDVAGNILNFILDFYLL